jgi:hypothetical protein
MFSKTILTTLPPTVNSHYRNIKTTTKNQEQYQQQCNSIIKHAQEIAVPI